MAKVQVSYKDSNGNECSYEVDESKLPHNNTTSIEPANADRTTSMSKKIDQMGDMMFSMGMAMMVPMMISTMQKAFKQ